MKQLLTLFLLGTLILTLAACSGATNTPISSTPESTPATQTISVEFENDLAETTSGETVSYIKLEGDSIQYDGSGATVSGSTITITSAGTYSLSGTLNSGQIIVDAADEDKVTLILNNASITSSARAPIFVRNAEKLVITLADGTQNSVTDSSPALFEDVESEDLNAAIFSKDDLTINGNGSLTVNANYNNGITSNDDLKITGGVITVNAVNDGLKGKNYIAVKAGTITVNAGGDGLQSNNDEDDERGYVLVEGGTLNITAAKDGIQAVTNVVISSGTLNLVTGTGSGNSSDKEGWGIWGSAGKTDTNNSAKGLKAGVDVLITGGSINIDSSDDAIHANNSLTINSGEILIASGDDGMHADSSLTINGGTVNITKSYEGIESAVITINDGNIRVTASDDGLNTAGGNDASAMGGRPGQNMFEGSSEYQLYINGGSLFVDALGDGLDSNGPITMTNGLVIVNGPTMNGNGPLDYSGSFNISGGYLLAVGSSGMAQAPSASSSQYSILYNFASPQPAGTLVHIQAADGKDILTFAPTKDYQSVTLSSSELTNSVTYIVSSGGTSSGTVVDGLYSGGTYSAGSQVDSFTTSGMVTYAGAASDGFGPRGGVPGGGGGPGGGGPRP